MMIYTRNRLTFRALQRGNPDGEVIILLHGFPADAESWLPVAEQLAQAGYYVLIPEQRGYSPQARPSSYSAYRLSELIEDTRALVATSRAKQVHLVGHDWGGAVAWAFASKYPAQVASLTIVAAPHPAAFVASLWQSRQIYPSWYMLFFQLPYLPEWLLTRNQGVAMFQILTKTGLDQHTATRYAQTMQARSLLKGALNWYRAMLWNLASIPIAHIKPRTLVLFGGQDKYVSSRAIQLTRRWVTRSGEVRLWPQSSHWIPETAPERLATTIQDFIRQVSP